MIPLVALLVLATMQVNAGDVVSVNVTDNALLTVSDNCMYFLENLQSSLNATPGEYSVKVGVNCTPGTKEVYANGDVIASFEVVPPGVNMTDYAAEKEKENLALQNKVKELEERLKKAEEEIDNLKSALEDAQNSAKLLELQNGLLKQQVAELEGKLKKVNSELQEKKSNLEKLEEKIRMLNRQSNIYRITTYFLISLIAGSFVALVFLARKE